jgi:hypothetical protein
MKFFLKKISNYLIKEQITKEPLRIVMLSPADSAGSGSRIRNAVRSVESEREIVIHLIAWRRRKLGYGEADIILSDGAHALKSAQKLLNLAHIVHFKDDNPPVMEMYGLKIPPHVKIIHTAGGSGFRRIKYPEISKTHILKKLDLALNSNWNMNLSESLTCNSGKDFLEIDSMNYEDEEHIRIKSPLIENINNTLVIEGNVNLIETKENSGFNVNHVIVEHINVQNKIITKTHKRFGSLKENELPFTLVFDPVNGQAAVRIIFYMSVAEKVNVKFTNLKFYEMTKDWYNSGDRPPFLKTNIKRKLKLNLDNIGNKNDSWWLINKDKDIVLSSTDEKLELNTLKYSGKEHVNIRSQKIRYINNAIAIYGDVELYQVNSQDKTKKFTVISEYFNGTGKVIKKIKHTFIAAQGRKTSWFLLFNSPNESAYVKITFHFPNYEKSWFKLDKLNFLEMSKKWNYEIEQEKGNITMGLWPLKTYQNIDLQTVLTPDLLISGEKIMYTPQGFPTTESTIQRNKNKRLVISHAPSNSSKKGTDSLILPALEILSKKYDFEIVLITGMAHDKCLEIIKKSDIFIDQVLVGFYGNAALEAMSYGIPTVAYLDEKYLRLVDTSSKKIPIINTKYQTKEAIVEALEPFLKKPTKLKNISKKTKKWVTKHHDYQIIGKLWLWNYENLFDLKLSWYQNLLEKIKAPFKKIGVFTLKPKL